MFGILGGAAWGGWQPGWALAAQSSPGARHGPIAGRRLRCGSGADTSHYHTQPRPLQQPNPAPSRDGGLNPPLLTPSKHSAAGSSQPAAGWIHFPAGRNTDPCTGRICSFPVPAEGSAPRSSPPQPVRHSGHWWVRELVWNNSVSCAPAGKKTSSTARKSKV